MEVHHYRWEGDAYGVAGLEGSKDVQHWCPRRGAAESWEGKC